jgi:hypothetical protein
VLAEYGGVGRCGFIVVSEGQNKRRGGTIVLLSCERSHLSVSFGSGRRGGAGALLQPAYSSGHALSSVVVMHC